jgi:hypothetical protein
MEVPWLLNEFNSRRILVEDRSWEKNVFNYVSSHQKADGGYTFVQRNEANAQDTCYGLAILRLLDQPFPNVGKTIEWLHRFELGKIYSYYYVGKALSLCSENLDDRFKEYVVSAIASRKRFISGDTYSEVASEFQFTQMIVELAKLSGVDSSRNNGTGWLLEHKNSDGGFGVHGYSDVSLTYCAIASLDLLGFDVKSLRDSAAFLRTCEKPYGGFAIVPYSIAPYVEYTYYGVMALDALGEHCGFPSQTADFILRCQNVNGGFARTDLGISTFENTFQAVSVMQKLTSP